MTYVRVRRKAAVRKVAEVGRTTLSGRAGYVQPRTKSDAGRRSDDKFRTISRLCPLICAFLRQFVRVLSRVLFSGNSKIPRTLHRVSSVPPATRPFVGHVPGPVDEK